MLKPYTKNDSDMLYQINKYNEINDIIKTLEVMNQNYRLNFLKSSDECLSLN